MLFVKVSVLVCRTELDKVPSGARIPPTRATATFKRAQCSFDSGDGSCMLYVITLKEFNHTNVKPLTSKVRLICRD